MDRTTTQTKLTKFLISIGMFTPREATEFVRRIGMVKGDKTTEELWMQIFKQPFQALKTINTLYKELEPLTRDPYTPKPFKVKDYAPKPLPELEPAKNPPGRKEDRSDRVPSKKRPRQEKAQRNFIHAQKRNSKPIRTIEKRRTSDKSCRKN